MTDKLQLLESLFNAHDCADFRWIDPRNIVVAQWVRLKCQFGCSTYGQHAVCPPNLPSVTDCRTFFDEYSRAALFHFARTVEKPEDRHIWTKGLDKNLLKLERAVFLAGYRKALAFTVDQCMTCDTCTGDRRTCRHPKLARPTLEGMAVDVFATVAQVGFPISVLTDYSDEMNRYALLMIE